MNARDSKEVGWNQGRWCPSHSLVTPTIHSLPSICQPLHQYSIGAASCRTHNKSEYRYQNQVILHRYVCIHYNNVFFSQVLSSEGLQIWIAACTLKEHQGMAELLCPPLETFTHSGPTAGHQEGPATYGREDRKRGDLRTRLLKVGKSTLRLLEKVPEGNGRKN